MELLKHKNDVEEYTYYLKNGKKIQHGLHKHWYSNGQLRFECNYKDGRFYGLRRGWNRDGQLGYEEYCQDGKIYESKEAYEEQLVANKDW